MKVKLDKRDAVAAAAALFLWWKALETFSPFAIAVVAAAWLISAGVRK